MCDSHQTPHLGWRCWIQRANVLELTEQTSQLSQMAAHLEVSTCNSLVIVFLRIHIMLKTLRTSHVHSVCSSIDLHSSTQSTDERGRQRSEMADRAEFAGTLLKIDSVTKFQVPAPQAEAQAELLSVSNKAESRDHEAASPDLSPQSDLAAQVAVVHPKVLVSIYGHGVVVGLSTRAAHGQSSSAMHHVTIVAMAPLPNRHDEPCSTSAVRMRSHLVMFPSGIRSRPQGIPVTTLC